MAPVKTGDEGAEQHGLNRDYIAGPLREVKEWPRGDPDFRRKWYDRHQEPVGDRFPKVAVVYTRVTATITATFEIRSKDDAEAAEVGVDAAKANLASGDVTVSYETERVEE